MDPREGTPQTVQSVDRAVQILDLLAAHDALGVSEISRELGVHRSTAFRLLSTLESRNLVQQEEHRGTYSLGFGLLKFAGAVSGRVDLVRQAQSACDAVTAELDETSNVAILSDGAAVNIAQATGARLVSVRRQYVGQRTPLHATSTGKVLLAHASPQALADALGAGLARFTNRTITAGPDLHAALESARAEGWAAAVEEWEDDTNAVAVPVWGSGGACVAALSVTAPSFRMTSDSFPDLVVTLRRHATDLGARLGG
ncbi:IclR family transcriptional regulator [Micrococcales bacterium 31B]|nr:IclR family transcriptional regulator [Micrococcales bacterium 31B]